MIIFWHLHHTFTSSPPVKTRTDMGVSQNLPSIFVGWTSPAILMFTRCAGFGPIPLRAFSEMGLPISIISRWDFLLETKHFWGTPMFGVPPKKKDQPSSCRSRWFHWWWNSSGQRPMGQALGRASDDPNPGPTPTKRSIWTSSKLDVKRCRFRVRVRCHKTYNEDLMGIQSSGM